jgi:hypothetical protein
MKEKIGKCHDCTAPQTEVNILSRHILELQADKGRLTDKVKELEAQIEKMRCCTNCKHSRTEYEHCKTDKHEKWEIKKMNNEELKQEAEKYAKGLCKTCTSNVCRFSAIKTCMNVEVIKESYLAGAEPREKRIAELEKENAELKELIEKYRQAVDKCLHITFMGAGCEVNTIGEYATLVDGYLTDVEGLAKWKN